VEAQVPSEREPNQPNQPDEPNGEPEQSADDARAWDEALLRARNELADADVIPSAVPDAAMESAADSAPIELTHVRRNRRTSRQHEAVLPPQQVTVRRRRQTGSMSLGPPMGEAGPPADLEPAAPVSPTSSPVPATPAPLDGSARARERSREREALERVLALAKPRARQTRATPAVLPPRSPDHGDDEPER
jgi:hypothetical protein